VAEIEAVDEHVVEPGQPSPDEIIAAVRSAGWLLEHDTETALRAAGYYTQMGQAFPDPDDNAISREIDVAGYRQLFTDKALAFTVGVRVIAECKQSTMPYVLIGRPPPMKKSQIDLGSNNNFASIASKLAAPQSVTTGNALIPSTRGPTSDSGNCRATLGI
jgi:hypothetical protein